MSDFNFDGVTVDPDLQELAHEVESHQFTEPLQPPDKPPNMLAQFAAGIISGRVWFRVGWTCTCVKEVLETAEQEMLLRGLIEEQLDIFQLQGNASASAGTHSKPGAYDIGQDSPEQIDVQRLCGGDGQARTTAQGFAVKHCHGFAQGCPHGSSGLLAQKRLWNRRLNGLISNGPVQGRWPTQNWQTAVAERKKIIMGLADDIAEKAADKVVARLKNLGTTPAETFSWQGVNVAEPGKPKNNWSAGHVLGWLQRAVATKDQVTALGAKVDALAQAIATIKTKIGA